MKRATAMALIGLGGAALVGCEQNKKDAHAGHDHSAADHLRETRVHLVLSTQPVAAEVNLGRGHWRTMGAA